MTTGLGVRRATVKCQDSFAILSWSLFQCALALLLLALWEKQECAGRRRCVLAIGPLQFLGHKWIQSNTHLTFKLSMSNQESVEDNVTPVVVGQMKTQSVQQSSVQHIFLKNAEYARYVHFKT